MNIDATVVTYIIIICIVIYILLYVFTVITDTAYESLNINAKVAVDKSYNNTYINSREDDDDYRKPSKWSPKVIRLSPPYPTFFSNFNGLVDGEPDESYLDAWELKYWKERKDLEASLSKGVENEKE